MIKVLFPFFFGCGSAIVQIRRLFVDKCKKLGNQRAAVFFVSLFESRLKIRIVVIQCVEPRSGTVYRNEPDRSSSADAVLNIIVFRTGIIKCRQPERNIKIPYCGHVQPVVLTLFIQIAACFKITVDVLCYFLNNNVIYP